MWTRIYLGNPQSLNMYTWLKKNVNPTFYNEYFYPISTYLHI